jgi:hypothetical protein
MANKRIRFVTSNHLAEEFGMRDRVELTRYAIRRGLIQP